MARYKHIDTSPRLLAIDLGRQLLPCTFEHALHHLIELKTRRWRYGGLQAYSGAPPPVQRIAQRRREGEQHGGQGQPVERLPALARDE